MIAPKPAGAFRVLHTADWHLGKLLGDLSREQEHARFLEFLVATVAGEEVDALVIAGDVFDSANPPQSALRQYYQFLSKLFAARDCAVVIVAGNHDSPAQLEAPRDVLQTLRATVVGHVQDDPVLLLPDAEHPRLAVAAIPFLRDRDLRSGQMGQGADVIRKALVDGIAKRYADAAARVATLGVPALATGHLTVAGSSVSESEREIHIGGLGAVTAKIFPPVFDYVALGHLHRPQACGGCAHVRYSGSPIPLSFSEAQDRKSLQLVDFDDRRLIGQAEIKLPLWRRLAQMRVKRSKLDEAMATGFDLEGELPTWVEVIVEDPVAGENLVELVREAAEGKCFEVVRVVTARARMLAGMREEEFDAVREEEDLLGDPVRVFSLRLDREDGLEASEREAMELLFRQVLEQHQQGAAGR